jgi:thiol-disulfide isomerase/thioredoxin
MRSTLLPAFLFVAYVAGQTPPSPAPAPAEVPPAPAKEPAKEPAKAPAPPQVLALGGELPKDLVLRDLDGKEQKFGLLRGKVVVFHFWSSTCPYEELAEPKLIRLAADFANKDVAVFGIASNHGEIGEAPDPKAFEQKDADQRPYAALRRQVAQVGCNHPILVDHGGTVAKLLGAQTTPHCFVFDPKGLLRYRGALDDSPNSETGADTKQYVRVAVEALRAGEQVPLAETKPYG